MIELQRLAPLLESLSLAERPSFAAKSSASGAAAKFNLAERFSGAPTGRKQEFRALRSAT
ncbi:MAG: hypothetical protein ACI4KG_09885, partial [Oscillospiraceae bacterium]